MDPTRDPTQPGDDPPPERDGWTPNSCSRFLPVNRQKRNPVLPGRGTNGAPIVPRACRRPRRFGRLWGLIVALALVFFGTSHARAVNEPRLVATFPVDEGAARSADFDGVTATYDRDINGVTSRIRLFDEGGNAVAGVSDLAGPQSPTGGKRTIKFTPYATLSEVGSPYTARAKVYPLAPGDPAVTEWTFAVDDTPPAPPVITDPTSGQVRRDQPVFLHGTTEDGAYVDVIENATVIARGRANSLGRISIELPYPPEDGVDHTLRVVAIDQAGNRSVESAPLSFRHDSVVHAPTIETPTERQALNSTSVVVAGRAKPSTTVTIRRSGSPVGTALTAPQGTWSVTIGFAPGTHVITAESFDGYLTDGPSDARTFTVDLTAPPAPAIAQPAPGATLPGQQVEVSGTAEARATVRIREAGLLRGTAVADAAGAWRTTIPFVDGPHTIRAEAVDAAGNVSAPSPARTFTVDTAVPAVPTIVTPAEDAFLATSAVTVTGAAEPGADVRIRRGTVTLGIATANGGGAWSIVLTLADGAHTISASAVDAAGNESAPSTDRSFTVDTSAPGPPAIEQPTPSSVETRSPVVVTGTAEPGATVEVREGGVPIGSAGSDSGGNWSVSITLANGTHTIVARAIDLAGNASAFSAPRTFTVSVSGDTTPPSAPTITAPPAGTLQRPTLVVKGTADPGATVLVSEGSHSIGSDTANAFGEWEFAATLVAGPHTIAAVAVDPAGNAGPASPPRSFTVDAARPSVSIHTPSGQILMPNQPLNIDGGAADDHGVARVELEYEDALTGRQVATATAICTGCPSSPVAWTDSQILPPGHYTIRAFAVDRVGNRSLPARISALVL